jgi:hypothetical protein
MGTFAVVKIPEHIGVAPWPCSNPAAEPFLWKEGQRANQSAGRDDAQRKDLLPSPIQVRKSTILLVLCKAPENQENSAQEHHYAVLQFHDLSAPIFLRPTASA